VRGTAEQQNGEEERGKGHAGYLGKPARGMPGISLSALA
jgi:hypothetical protein